MAARKTPLAKTHCIRGHAMTEENTYLWVNKAGYTTRNCRQCRRITDAHSRKMQWYRNRRKQD